MPKNELVKQRIREIKAEMKDRTREEIAKHLIKELSEITEKAWFEFEAYLELYHKGEISKERILLIEEQTLNFMETTNEYIKEITGWNKK